MLRRWPQRSLASAPAALQLQAPQRSFWSQAVEILSRLKPSDAGARGADKESDMDSTSRAAKGWRPPAPGDVSFPDFLHDAGEGQIAHSKQVFADFARHLRRATDRSQAWDVVKQCRPFVVESGGGIRFADVDSDAASDKANAPDVLQMLPADLFAERTAGSNCRSMFVSATASEGTITAANEAVVVALLVEGLHARGQHWETISFFDGYNRERKKWLKERAAPEDAGNDDEARQSAEEQKKVAEFVRTTRLWAPARSAYLKSLLAKSRYHKIVQFAHEDPRNLDVACESIATMTSLLIGCRKQKDSALARLALDTMSRRNPVAVLPLAFYELAFKSAMQKKNRGQDDVENALWIARAMRDDAGYVLRPDLWFALFNTSLHLKREDYTLEAFGMYSSNFRSLHQDCFRRALRKPCRLSRPDVVLAMVRQWLAAIGDDVDAEAKTKVTSFVLWEMVSSGHPVSAITEMLDIMESSRIEATSAVLQRVAKLLLDDASSKLSPHDTIKDSLEFWKARSSAVQNSVYVMYVLLQQCLERGWLDECELVVNEIVERRLPGVPCNSIVKAMAANEERERFENSVSMCEVLLKSLSRTAFKTLNQQFFEHYLKALLCLGRFTEVREQHGRLKLDKRFPKSTAIAVALRDAKAQHV